MVENVFPMKDRQSKSTFLSGRLLFQFKIEFKKKETVNFVCFLFHFIYIRRHFSFLREDHPARTLLNLEIGKDSEISKSNSWFQNRI